MEDNYIQLDFEVRKNTEDYTSKKNKEERKKLLLKQLTDTWHRFVSSAIGPENRHAASAILGCSVTFMPDEDPEHSEHSENEKASSTASTTASTTTSSQQELAKKIKTLFIKSQLLVEPS